MGGTLGGWPSSAPNPAGRQRDRKFVSHPHNLLIGRLPDAQRRRLLARCDTVALAAHEIICVPGERSARVYFILTGRVSLVSVTAAGPGLEVAMVGAEGMVGAQAALGPTAVSWLRGTVLQGGSALTVSADELQTELADSAPLQRVMLDYVSESTGALALTAACVHFHALGPRLARWLLMSQDREGSADLQTTHAGMAQILGVRRVGVTAAAGHLQRSGLIEYVRGDLTILDRVGLEALACSCYTPTTIGG